MEVVLKEMSNEVDDDEIRCLQSIVDEQDAHTVLTLNQKDETSIRTWVKKQNHHFLSFDQHEVMMYWIYANHKVVGVASLKKKLQVELYAESGHIGIFILHFYRHKGIGKQALFALIQIAQQTYHMEDILLCCKYDNIASRALCKGVGGVLKHEDSYCHYWISQHVDQINDI